MNIDRFFIDEVIRDIALQPSETNKRTGVKVKAKAGVTFRTDLETEGFPLLSLRRIGMAFVPEQMWFCSGGDRTDWLSKHTKIWDSFAEESGVVTSAYGARWRNLNHLTGTGFDQLGTVIEKLRADPSTRHGVVVTWKPQQDLTVKQKNVPCPVMFTLNIIEGRLNLHVIVRSNDMVLGFPTDAAGFAFLQMMLAQELGVTPGVYTHSISNAHVYANQMDAIVEMAKRQPQVGRTWLELPSNSFKRAEKLDDTLITDVKAGLTGYDPSPAILNIPIAL